MLRSKIHKKLTKIWLEVIDLKGHHEVNIIEDFTTESKEILEILQKLQEIAAEAVLKTNNK